MQRPLNLMSSTLTDVICKHVIPFRAFARTRAGENVQVELELVFSQTSNEPIPSNADIVETLKEAATNPASGFNLTIDDTSISVVSKLKSQLI